MEVVAIIEPHAAGYRARCRHPVAAEATGVSAYEARLALEALARYQDLLRQRLNVGGNDLRIAAIALEIGAIVVTCNLRDFCRIPNLQCVDWSV